MTEAIYCGRADTYKYGLPRGLLANAGRLVASVDASANTLSLDGHGFETDDQVTFRAESGGTLPTPLTAGTVYYAIRSTDSVFQVSATESGAAIDITAAGENTLVATPLPEAEIREFYSRMVDSFLPAHQVPLEAPYPILVVATVAELTAKKLLLLMGQESVSMTEVEGNARALLERWSKGLPVRDAKATAPANLAVGQAATDARGWGTGLL